MFSRTFPMRKLKTLLPPSSDRQSAYSENRVFLTQEERYGAPLDGWLFKRGLKKKSRKERWFVLHGGALYYFKNGESSYPLGVVFLRGASLCVSDSMTLELHSLVSLTCTDSHVEMSRERVFQLTCKSTLSFAEWQRELSRCIEECRHLEPVTRCGWLEKRGHVNTDWSKRYFVCLADMLLVYFGSERESRALGLVSLERVSSAVDVEQDDRQHCFRVMAGERELICNAASSALQIEWLEFLIAKCHLSGDGSARRLAVERELDEEAKKELQRGHRVSEKLKKAKQKVLERVPFGDSGSAASREQEEVLGEEEEASL